MYSFWHQTFSETYTIDDILWFKDTDTIEWGEIKEGRPPLEERGSWLEWSVNNSRGVEYRDGSVYPGLGNGTEEDNVVHTNPPERIDRRERTREDGRREDRRGRR